MPTIVKKHPNILYLVGGAGPGRDEIEQTIKRHSLADNVKLLGKVSDNCLKALYNVADIFIMPNIPIPNDMEGFGLVALEAASCGALVVASNLEGISDAVVNGKNGYLVPAKDAAAYVETVNRELVKRTLSASAIRRYTMQHYSWDVTARQYRVLFGEESSSHTSRLGNTKRSLSGSPHSHKS